MHNDVYQIRSRIRVLCPPFVQVSDVCILCLCFYVCPLCVYVFPSLSASRSPPAYFSLVPASPHNQRVYSFACLVLFRFALSHRFICLARHVKTQANRTTAISRNLTYRRCPSPATCSRIGVPSSANCLVGILVNNVLSTLIARTYVLRRTRHYAAPPPRTKMAVPVNSRQA